MSPARKPRNEEKNVTNEDTPQEIPVDAGSVPSENYGVTNVEQAEIEGALARKTQDGKGSDDVPASDFDSYATEGVEKGEDDDQLHTQRIAEEVLAGRWGPDEEIVRQKLVEQDYIPGIIFLEVNRRLSAGAPSALERPNPRRVATQVIAGEWGPNENVIKQRLNGAGHNLREIEIEMRKQLGQTDSNGNAKHALEQDTEKEPEA